MLDIRSYSKIELLRQGRQCEIRALKPGDRDEFLAAVERISSQSLYRRFFAAKRSFSEGETAFFLNPDFVNHVALVAVVEEGGRPTIVAGGRYVIVESGKAEVAFVVIDQYQGQGIGTALLRHLILIARAAGLKQLIADVLPDNAAMLKVFRQSGLSILTRRESGGVHVTLELGERGTSSRP